MINKYYNKYFKYRKKYLRGPDMGKENYYFTGKIFIKGDVQFGNYCAIGENLRIISSNHNYHLPALQAIFYRKHFKEKYPGGGKSKKIIIGNDIWFGDNVILLPGVKIGDGACIGAGAVVTKDIPPYAIACGVPAKVIKYRFSKVIIAFLLQIKWWEWSEEKIKKNKRFFMTDLSNVNSIEDVKKLIE